MEGFPVSVCVHNDRMMPISSATNFSNTRVVARMVSQPLTTLFFYCYES